MGMPPEKTSGGNKHLLIGAVITFVLLAGWYAYPWFNEYLELRPDRGDFQGNSELLARIQQVALPVNAAGTRSADWAQWRGPRRNGVADGKDLIESWPPSGPPVLGASSRLRLRPVRRSSCSPCAGWPSWSWPRPTWRRHGR